jgi:hypothetical protein
MLQAFVVAHTNLFFELSGLFVLFAAVIFIAGLLISRFDAVPLEDAIYFAFITAFTVGFGDVTPISRGARIVTICLAFSGLILVGIVVAISVHAIDIALKSSVL